LNKLKSQLEMLGNSINVVTGQKTRFDKSQYDKILDSDDELKIEYQHKHYNKFKSNEMSLDVQNLHEKSIEIDFEINSDWIIGLWNMLM